MSDSDSDYVDIAENDTVIVDDTNDNVETARSGQSKGRGKYIEWLEVARYIEKATYENLPFNWILLRIS